MPSSSSSSSLHLSHKLSSTMIKVKQEPKKASSSGYRDQSRAEMVRYGECMKNHAARIGGYAVDGCHEFMASGEEGTSAALRCAACDCHRSFHKRIVVVKREEVCDCSSMSSSQR